MPRAKCGKSTERTVDFYLTECKGAVTDGERAAYEAAMTVCLIASCLRVGGGTAFPYRSR